jgi:hypothetical protein
MSDIETSGEVVPATDPLAALILERATVTAEDPDAIAAEIVARILAAETVDEVLAPRGTIPIGHLLGEPIEVRAVRWHRSDYADGPAVYAVADVVIAGTGERATVTCGARNVMAALWRLDDLGVLPITVEVVEAERASRAGYRPLWLQRPRDDSF